MIKIIDYKAGNAPSVMCAVKHLMREAEFAQKPADLNNATHIILPGVGSAKETMQSIKELGLIEALENAVLEKKVLFLGICVGMQILFEQSEEDNAKCLGWLKGRVVKFDNSKVKVPQMGWNKVSFVKNAPLNARDDYFYFVNSYYAKPADEADLWGVANYNGSFAAAACKGNIYATQFHVEKSGEAGLRVLNNFIQLEKGK